MPSDDFVFGTLGSEALRMAHVRSLNAGVTHRSARSPRDPLPGQPVTLELNLGVIQPYDRAWVYWSVDGQEPQGGRAQSARRLVGRSAGRHQHRVTRAGSGRLKPDLAPGARPRGNHEPGEEDEAPHALATEGRC